MRLLACILLLSLAGSSVATADDGKTSGVIHVHSLVVMRALVPADEIGGYEAFSLAVTRPAGVPFSRVKEEQEHFGSGEGRISYDDAVAEWEARARDGDSAAMSNLGVMYALGLGAPSDAARAVELWRGAADRGAATARNNLGIAYALGRGVERDEAQAIRWLGAAGQNGLLLAENNLGVLYVVAGDERSGTVWLSRAVTRGGYGAAVRNLARLYETKTDDPGFDEWFWGTVVPGLTGWPPRPDEPLKAYDWFDRAADRGFPAGARKRALAEAAERASTERWVMPFLSAPEHQLRKEEELISKIGTGLCRFYRENTLTRAKKVLKNGSTRYVGRELSLERAYRYVRCYQPDAENIDLIRVTAERPARSRGAAQDLVDYFVEEVAGGKFLLGKIVMCQRDFGYGCLNVLGHIEKNLEASEGNTASVEALNDFKKLLHNNLDEEHLKHNHGLCRAFLDEPESCRACSGQWVKGMPYSRRCASRIP